MNLWGDVRELTGMVVWVWVALVLCTKQEIKTHESIKWKNTNWFTWGNTMDWAQLFASTRTDSTIPHGKMHKQHPCKSYQIIEYEFQMYNEIARLLVGSTRPSFKSMTAKSVQGVDNLDYQRSLSVFLKVSPFLQWCEVSTIHLFFPLKRILRCKDELWSQRWYGM